MNAVAERLYSGTVGTTAVDLFTSVLATEITRVEVVKRVAGTATLQLFHVPNGETAGTQHRIYNGPEGTLLESNVEGAGVTLSPGDVLRAEASVADAFTIVVYGVTESVQHSHG